MNMKHKITAAACVGALACMGAIPAFAADTSSVSKNEGTADVSITALVAEEGTDIVSVTVPSTMALAITTHAADGSGVTKGTFKEATAPQADVTNNAISTKGVKVSVAKVTEKTGELHSQSLLNSLNIKLMGDNDKSVVLATNTPATPLFGQINPGSTAHINLSAEAKAGNTTVIEGDSYTITPTLKVETVTAP